MASFLRAPAIALSFATIALSAGCASSGKPVAKVEEKPITVTVEAPAVEKDALGNYRFLMQQGETRMSADQFDAWMKANGIRVAKGAPAAVPEAAKPGKN